MNSHPFFTTFFFLCFYLTSNAQTIEVVDGPPTGCVTTALIPVATFSLFGNDSGTPQRNIYTAALPGPAATAHYIIIWDAVDNRWELQADFKDAGGNFGVADGVYETELYSNSFASAPNPPQLGAGTWVGVPFPADLAAAFGSSDCDAFAGGMVQFNGSGTQSALTPLSVPTLSEWGLIILALLLLNLGTLAIIQRKLV